MEIVELNENSFNDFIAQKGKKVIVDFYASWCGPCKMLAPILEDIAKEAGENYKFAKVNVDESFSVAKNYTVMSIPTIIAFEDGVEVARVVGLKSKEDLISQLL